MQHTDKPFIVRKYYSAICALKGLWLLITTEESIKIQSTIALIAIGMGFYFDISPTEWMIQLLVIGLVLVAEAANTAVEKVADFIHPEYHERIGFIKDIAAGAPAIAALISLVIAGIIYIPKIMMLLG
ncbi:diacylglycerol kinase (ATP) [Lutibacter sp. Hel_I_33_5]|uniref:diacylglycerol kinase n=1 Tax=Lutibacter sp. Hel_I_33_5 TaxID=1566289 RepID=UPI0011A589FD|nr:diacylglycerol kinase family protein [Lutibacter sp. Hel_I_33_5]TVZ57390.1 diacylglycerol kinase (ATP) [Lutibacter sp. Hel_I_33_5]